MTTKFLLNTLRALTTSEDHPMVHQCLDMSVELIRQGDEQRAARAARVARVLEEFMCSGDVEVLIRSLPPAPATVTDTREAEALFREASKRGRDYKALDAARCFLQTVIQEAKGKEATDIYPIFSFLEKKGISLLPTPKKAPKMTAAQCIVKMARATPDHGDPCFRTEEMLYLAGYGISVAAVTRQAKGILREWERCGHEEHPGQDALYMAILPSLAIGSKGGEAKIEEAARYAMRVGVDVSGPLVEYILRREN